MEKTGYCGALLLLGFLTGQDIRTRKISAAVLAGSAVMAVSYLMFAGLWSVERVTSACMPGMLLLALSLVTKESIGYGDGAVVLLLGLWTGAFFCLFTMLLGFVFSGIYALLSLAGRRKERIPFLPFLLAAMEVMLFYA